MWIYTKRVLTGGQNPTPEMNEYLKQRLMSIMLCVNWVCAGTFVIHEWVSESTITQQEEVEVMGREFGLRKLYPVCGAMVYVVVLSAHTVESNAGKESENQKKYHEAVNMAIAYAISMPFRGVPTPRTCMLSSVATVLHKTHRKWGVNKEMEGWEMGGKPVLLPCVDHDVDEYSDE